MKAVFELFDLSAPGESIDIPKGHYKLQKDNSSNCEFGMNMSALYPWTQQHTERKLIVGHQVFISEYHRYAQTSPVVKILKVTKSGRKVKAVRFRTLSGSVYTLTIMPDK